MTTTVSGCFWCFGPVLQSIGQSTGQLENEPPLGGNFEARAVISLFDQPWWTFFFLAPFAGFDYGVANAVFGFHPPATPRSKSSAAARDAGTAAPSRLSSPAPAEPSLLTQSLPRHDRRPRAPAPARSNPEKYIPQPLCGQPYAPRPRCDIPTSAKLGGRSELTAEAAPWAAAVGRGAH